MVAHVIAFTSAGLWYAILCAAVQFAVPSSIPWKPSMFRVATWMAVAVGVLTWILAYRHVKAAMETRKPVGRAREKA